MLSSPPRFTTLQVKCPPMCICPDKQWEGIRNEGTNTEGTESRETKKGPTISKGTSIGLQATGPRRAQQDSLQIRRVRPCLQVGTRALKSTSPMTDYILPAA